MPKPTTTHLSAREAAERLGVSLATLYAYVSRGLLGSEPTGPGVRTRRYRRDEIERLLARREHRRDPAKATATALDWGGPVLESALTSIDGGRLFYRGHEVMTLARERSFEDVAHLLWCGELPSGGSELFAGAVPALPASYLRALPPGLEPWEKLQVLLPLAALDDLRGHDPRPEAMVRCGARIVRLMTIAIAGGLAEGRVAEVLARALCPGEPAAAPLLDAALIAAADHELNVSSFTARCVASAGSTPYDVVIAGLAALRGQRHGGLSARTEAMLRQLWSETAGEPEQLPQVLARRLGRGEALPGFGQPLYPEGDPRGKALLELIAERLPGAARTAWVRAAADAARELLGEHPTIDYALAALALALELPTGSALALFALGRTAGWIAHALEQTQTGKLIRPRARYVGPRVTA